MGIRKACALALGTELTGVTAAVVNSLVNYSAICISSSLNVYCMRSAEMQNGISVLDPDTMEPVGKSKVAAKMGVMKSIQGRWTYCLPIFFTGPMLNAIFGRFLPKTGPVKFVFDLAFIATGLWIAMPVCCGLFEQYS